MKINIKRFEKYQVDDVKRYGGNGIKFVDKLTETEAKRELCDAMDLIQSMLAESRRNRERVKDLAAKYNYI